MIVSKEHNFIFLKTRKTAGSSLQVALSTICNPHIDIITGSQIKEGKLDESHSGGWNLNMFFTNHPHPPISQVKNWMSDKWGDYFKFAFVRNPFDIVVSRYHWNMKGKGARIQTSVIQFQKWIHEYIKSGAYKQDLQYPYICIDGKVDLNFIGRYENLQIDYEKICHMIGLDIIPTLGFQKSGYRDKTHYSEFYDEKTIGLIEGAFKQDLELFGYKFEYKKDFEVVNRKPIITQELACCKNINGPSLIKTPDWLKNPLGKYYLYFADHQGTHIKMAYSNDINGPYTLYDKGTLKLSDTSCKTHIASPDVHVKDNEIVMYYHGDIYNHQYTMKSTSRDGINFITNNDVLTPFYHREFEYQENTYAICKNRNENSHIYELINDSYKLQFEFLPRSRHTAVHIDGDIMYIFYTLVKESPERIYVLKLVDWIPVSNYELIRPEFTWEGSELQNINSQYGMSHGFVNQLRDPAIYEESGEVYLLYSYGGESGIAIAHLKNLT
jgi:hypothetical protein